MLVYITVALLIAFGLYAIMFKKNLIKIVIGINLIEAGVNLFLISLGYIQGGYAPIYTLAPEGLWKNMVLPTPQALTLTSIVIGLATTALMLSFVIMIYKNYKTVSSKEVGRLLSD
ncbi:MAG: cation:proton antiporter subunit C [Candidatus Diapherotrites archaeon]|nr:cation:proton antiporter subunit C [Candidatus Diapherotrites archaeon]